MTSKRVLQHLNVIGIIFASIMVASCSKDTSTKIQQRLITLDNTTYIAYGYNDDKKYISITDNSRGSHLLYGKLLVNTKSSDDNHADTDTNMSYIISMFPYSWDMHTKDIIQCEISIVWDTSVEIINDSVWAVLDNGDTAACAINHLTFQF